MSHEVRLSSRKFILAMRVLACAVLLGICVVAADRLITETKSNSGFSAEAIGMTFGLLLVGVLISGLIWFLSWGYEYSVFDAGDVLFVGRRRRRLPLESVTDVVFVVPSGKGGRVHVRIELPRRLGPEISYIPRDLEFEWSGVSEPRSVVELRARVQQAKLSPNE